MLSGSRFHRFTPRSSALPHQAAHPKTQREDRTLQPHPRRRTALLPRIHQRAAKAHRRRSLVPLYLSSGSEGFSRYGSNAPFFICEHDSPQVCSEVPFKCASGGPGCFSFSDFLVVETLVPCSTASGSGSWRSCRGRSSVADRRISTIGDGTSRRWRSGRVQFRCSWHTQQRWGTGWLGRCGLGCGQQELDRLRRYCADVCRARRATR